MTGPVLLELAPPVGVVRLADRAGHNRISAELAEGMRALLADAAARPEIRAVVLEGLPHVFSAGGTPERMLGPREGRVEQVWRFLRTVLTCPVPVVAAAAGHALGGGLLLALYCDLQVFSDRSRYGTPFATYGMTPIGGATFVVPHAFGATLGREMLYTGRTYRGRDLAARGAGVRVVAHDRVVAEAHRTALYVAQGTRAGVERLKEQFAGPILRRAEAALRGEEPAHEETAGTADTERRIEMWYGRLARRADSAAVAADHD